MFVPCSRIISLREAVKKKIADLRTRSQSWGEGSNQTLIKKFSAIKTENLREGGSSLNYKFLISKQFNLLKFVSFNSALFKGVRVIVCLNFIFINGGSK